MNQIAQILTVAAIYFVLALVTTVEHVTLADRLKQHEYMRYVIGVVTVFVATSFFVLLPLPGWLLLLLVLGGFAVAGGTLWVLLRLEKGREVEAVRKRIVSLTKGSGSSDRTTEEVTSANQ